MERRLQRRFVVDRPLTKPAQPKASLSYFITSARPDNYHQPSDVGIPIACKPFGYPLPLPCDRVPDLSEISTVLSNWNVRR